MNTIDEPFRLKKEMALRNIQSSQTALDYQTYKRARNLLSNHLYIQE